jgi:excisionase family DNA binding protein
MARAIRVEDYVTTAEAAAVLGVTPVWVSRMVAAGRLRGRRIAPRLMLIRRADVERDAAEYARAARGPAKRGRPRKI